MNYSYCSRLFSQETGMTFSKYLIQYRLKKAKTLLENKDMKISFIAFEVGYNDVSHFIQSFKKSYGLTPEEYRARKKSSENKEKSYILQVKIFIKLRPLLC
ncbi:MAG: helix-turn-helix domain-containing protein [Anaerobutyricum sp.]